MWVIGVVSTADRSFPNSPRQPTCRRALVFVRNGRRVTYCSPSCTLRYPTRSPSGSPKSFMRASTRSLRTEAGFGDSSVSLTDSASQLNRETARSVTVGSKQRRGSACAPCANAQLQRKMGRFWRPTVSCLTRRPTVPAPVSLNLHETPSGQRTPVCSENLSSDVMMVKSAKDGV
jgi:hypothetical protein